MAETCFTAQQMRKRSLQGPRYSYRSHRLVHVSRAMPPTIIFNPIRRDSEAEPLCRRALDMSEQMFGPHHPKVATCLNNLATQVHMILESKASSSIITPLFFSNDPPSVFSTRTLICRVAEEMRRNASWFRGLQPVWLDELWRFGTTVECQGHDMFRDRCPTSEHECLDDYVDVRKSESCHVLLCLS